MLNSKRGEGFVPFIIGFLFGITATLIFQGFLGG